MIRLNKETKPLYLFVSNKFKSSTTRVIFNEELSETKYQSDIVERNKYAKWENNGIFEPQFKTKTTNFSMMLPPPNITGKLHLGHALSCAIQDVIARRKRSLGYNVLWLPGTDHAGIATQSVVEKFLQSTQKINRHSIGREKFIKEVWKWKDNHGDTIGKQLKQLGCSLDWSREVFTMDPRYTHAVNSAFIKLFEKGLIYRKTDIINWCNILKSTVSDIEIENLPINGPTNIMLPGYKNPVQFGLIYTFAYKILDTDEEILVSTTLPETMLGDTAIAVHPDDERYKHLRGAMISHPFRETKIPVVHDEMVDMKFGTGAVKITPAHSKFDYLLGKRHNLPLLQILDQDGKIQNGGKFNGLNKYECRKAIVEELNALDMMKSVENHNMTLPICSRTGDVIEYMPKEQWFLFDSELNKKATQIVKEGKLKIIPERFVQKWDNWINMNKEWCISRQLWWGHQIPAYKCSVGNNSIWLAAINENLAKLQASKLLETVPEEILVERDTDVLDTWFSSGIYPMASLGWPDQNNEDFKHFYPTDMIVTGHDILGFWIYRMVILALSLTDKIPFNNVLLHGVLHDHHGAKMSKSKGNVIDPIEVINGISLETMKGKAFTMHKDGLINKEELNRTVAYNKSNFSTGIPKCGADALRFTLLSYDFQSEYISFDVNTCKDNAFFCNKIWQSVKYTKLSFDKLKPMNDKISVDDLTIFDKWILSKLASSVEYINHRLDEHKFHLATLNLRKLIYERFCNEYLEATKPGFESDNIKTGYAHAHTLSAFLNVSLRCLAPFMVHITEELIPKIPAFETNIVCNFNDVNEKYFEFPKSVDFSIWKNEELDKQAEKLFKVIFLIRELKGQYNISNSTKPHVYINSTDEKLLTNLRDHTHSFLNLSRSGCILFEKPNIKNIIRTSLDDDTIINIEINKNDYDEVILLARKKWEEKVKKINNLIKKVDGKPRKKGTVSDLKKELEQLQNKIKNIQIN